MNRVILYCVEPLDQERSGEDLGTKGTQENAMRWKRTTSLLFGLSTAGYGSEVTCRALERGAEHL